MTKGINKEKRICSWVLFLRRLRLCWCEGARTRRRVVETNQPSKRPPTDQPGGGAEALGMLVGQSSPNRRAVEMRALVFWKFRRYQISCIIFTLSSQYPPSIGVRWYATSVALAVYAILCRCRARRLEAVRTWVILLGVWTRHLSVAIEQSRSCDRHKEVTVSLAREKIESVTSVLRFIDYPYFYVIYAITDRYILICQNLERLWRLILAIGCSRWLAEDPPD